MKMTTVPMLVVSISLATVGVCGAQLHQVSKTLLRVPEYADVIFKDNLITSFCVRSVSVMARPD